MRAKQWRKGMLIGFLLVVISWLLINIYGLVTKATVAVREANQVKAQYQDLESRKAALSHDLDALATPLGQDAAIRTAFGVARPGEEVIVVVPPKEAATGTLERSWWDIFLSWF